MNFSVIDSHAEPSDRSMLCMIVSWQPRIALVQRYVYARHWTNSKE